MSQLDKDLDPAKVKYLETIRYIEKTFASSQKRAKPAFNPFMKLDGTEVIEKKRKLSMSRLGGDFRKKIVIPNRDKILLPELNTNDQKLIEDEKDNEYKVDEATNEIIVKKISLPRNKSMDFENIEVDYNRFSHIKRKQKTQESIPKNKEEVFKRLYKKNDCDKIRLTISREIAKRRNKSTVSLYGSLIPNYNISKVKSKERVLSKLKFPTFDERNNLRILRFLNSKFDFYKKNNNGINALSQEFINVVNNTNFPVKTIYHVEELER